MNRSDKILVAGASGMVGSALIRNLVKKGFANLVGTFFSKRMSEQNDLPVTYRRVDLTNQAAVTQLFKAQKPDYVFLAAAKVGGIHANNTFPAQFIHANLAMQTHIIHAAFEHRVKRLLFLGSSCIYPRNAPQPMKEEYLLTGTLEPTNEPYAIAKIAGIKMCEAYNRQYGTRFLAVMPTNLYGPNDNFDLETSHVLPALIKKCHEAKIAGVEKVEIWGTGTPRREFLHVDDMADASVHVMSLPDPVVDTCFIRYPSPCFVNVGTGKDCTILELARKIKQITGFQGKLEFDPSRPDGTPLKRLDITRLRGLGWQGAVSLEEGIKATYDWFVQNEGNHHLG
jgi:GDP-L-fucose synthase